MEQYATLLLLKGHVSFSIKGTNFLSDQLDQLSGMETSSVDGISRLGYRPKIEAGNFLCLWGVGRDFDFVVLP